MKKPYDRIWLQVDGSDYDDGEKLITWCEDKINDTDVEYIRKDLFDALNKNYLELQEMYVEELKHNEQNSY